MSSIEKVNSVPVKCIEVENHDGMFLCGHSMIPTHNSTISAALLDWAIRFYPKNTAIILNFKKETALENLKKIKFINCKVVKIRKKLLFYHSDAMRNLISCSLEKISLTEKTILQWVEKTKESLIK
jgi:hypothetical protein